MNATTRGSLLAALACVLVGGSFTANSVLGHYPYAGGQFLRYGLACALLLPLAARNGTAPLRAARAPAVDAARPARGRGHGRLQPRRARGGTHGGTGRPRGLRGLCAGRRGRVPPPHRGAPPAAPGPVRGDARRAGRLHRPGLGPYRRRGHRVLRVRAGRRGGLRGPRRAGAAPPGPTAPVGHRVRDRRARVRGGRDPRRRPRMGADAGRRRGHRAAVAGGGGHGGRFRGLVHGRAAHRRGARHALLRPHPRRGGLDGAARRHRHVRRRAGRRQRAGRCGSGPRLRSTGAPCRETRPCRRHAVFSGCRPG